MQARDHFISETGTGSVALWWWKRWGWKTPFPLLPHESLSFHDHAFRPPPIILIFPKLSNRTKIPNDEKISSRSIFSPFPRLFRFPLSTFDDQILPPHPTENSPSVYRYIFDYILVIRILGSEARSITKLRTFLSVNGIWLWLDG